MISFVFVVASIANISWAYTVESKFWKVLNIAVGMFWMVQAFQS